MAEIYDVIIIGGGPAGLTSAIYGGRAKLKVLVIEKDNIGGQISFTNEVVNYPGILKISGTEFMKNMREQAKNFGANFVQEEVINVDLAKDIKEILTEKEKYKAYSVIIASGLVHKELNFVGEKKYIGKGVSYCSVCDGEFFINKDIFVIGAGYSACEEAIYLTRYGRKVHIIAREPEFTCAKSIAEKVMKNSKIEVSFNSEIVELDGDNFARKIKIKNNKTGEIVEYSSNDGENIGVFVLIGQEPKTEIYKKNIKLDDDGYILTDTKMQTNLDKVYAVGDIRQKSLRQLVTAVSDGAIAVLDLEKSITNIDRDKNLEEEKIIEEKIEEIKKDETSKIFSDSDINLLKENFKNFKEKIKLILIKSQDEKKNKDAVEFGQELVKLSNKIEFEVYDEKDKNIPKNLSLERLPAFFLLDKFESYKRIKYSTLPIENELESFIQAMSGVACVEENIRESLLNRIEKLNKKINVKIGVSLKCTRCPQTIKSTQSIILKNKNIDLEVIDVTAHKDFKTKYDIVGVPAIVIDDKNLYFGQMNLEEMIEILEKQ